MKRNHSSSQNQLNHSLDNWLRFLRWFCPTPLYEGIEGDLMEQFDYDLKKIGEKYAKRQFIINVIKFFRPGILLRSNFAFQLISTIMWKSYFTITWRNLLKSKGYSFINILGLALGIACFLLTVNYLRFEFSFDQMHPNVERTYRVNQTLLWRPEGGIFGSTALPLAGLMKKDYPEVEEALRINTPGGSVVRYDDGQGKVLAFNEANVLAADSNFFSFFAFNLKEGNPQTALQGINKVVISEETAKKFFGDEPALGKILLLGNDRNAVEVSGVTEHQPDNMHFQFDYLLSMYTNPNIKKFEWSWIWTQVVTYVRLRPDASPEALESKMANIGEQVIKPSFERFGINFDDFIKGKGWNFYLMPVTDIHLKSEDNRLGAVGDIKYAYTFAAIGFFVLLIAAINFINLSTARGTMRAKEVGVKKALGAMRKSLVSQFQFESIFLSIAATLIGLLLVEALRLTIKNVTQIEIPFTLWSDQGLMILVPLLPLIIGFLAGLYPSFYLTSFQPIKVLKGKWVSGMGNSSIRNGLVITQFIISISLMAGTIVVFQQLRFMSKTNLGFDKDNILIINDVEKMGDHLEAFRNEVSTYPGVESVAIAMDVPGRGMWEDIFTREGSDAKLPVSQIKIDDQYFKTMNFEMAAGRSFEKERPSDDNAIIPNETTVRLFGWTPEEAIGQKIIYPGNDYTAHEIIGVVKDFHFQSLRQSIAPLLFGNVKSTMWGDMRALVIKYKSDDLSGLIHSIENNWNKVLEETPMQYSFLDQEWAKQYEQENKLGGMFGIFSALSIAIAIIGLVGLVSYSAEIRKKELGIRKVFGASTSVLVFMMNSQYMKLIIVALLVAAPASWWLMQQWLNTFAFRIDLSPITFVLAGITEIAIAILSVGYLSWRAANLNPAKVLRDE